MKEAYRHGLEIEMYPFLGSISSDVELGQVLFVHGKYYFICTMNRKKDIAGVREATINLDPSDMDYEYLCTCPYCGRGDNDSWELYDEEEEHECGYCGGIFSYQREVTVQYCSQPIKPPKIVKANWMQSSMPGGV